MSDEIAALTTEEAQRLGEAKLDELLAGGGKKTVHLQCETCGSRVSKEVELADSDMLVRILKYREDKARGSKQPGDIGAKASEVLARVRELTDDALAAEIARLRHG